MPPAKSRAKDRLFRRNSPKFCVLSASSTARPRDGKRRHRTGPSGESMSPKATPPSRRLSSANVAKRGAANVKNAKTPRTPRFKGAVENTAKNLRVSPARGSSASRGATIICATHSARSRIPWKSLRLGGSFSSGRTPQEKAFTSRSGSVARREHDRVDDSHDAALGLRERQTVVRPNHALHHAGIR